MCPGRLILGLILFITLCNGLENCVESMLTKLKDNKNLHGIGHTLKDRIKINYELD